jgi:hypothetical protein
MGSPPIGTSMMALTSSGGFLPIEMWSKFIGRSWVLGAIRRDFRRFRDVGVRDKHATRTLRKGKCNRVDAP